jgi:hypothetical protein
MANVSHIKDLIRTAMEKQASSMDNERSKENEEDVKKAVPASVDSQNPAEATGTAEKNPAMNIGTKAESSTDTEQNGMKKEDKDDDAFKSASELRKLASSITAAIAKAAAEETALTDDAPENANTNTDTKDSKGSEEPMRGTESPDGSATQTDTSTDQKAPVNKEEASRETSPEADPAEKSASEKGKLATSIYKLAKTLLYSSDEQTKALYKQANIDPAMVEEEEVGAEDVDNLEDEEADEVAAALEAAALEAEGEGAQDGDNVADYLESYQAAANEGAPEDVPEVAPEVAPEIAPEVGDDQEIEQLIQLLEEAGVNPEELMGMVGTKSASVKKDNGWTKLSKTQRHDVILSVFKDLKKGDK